MRRAATRLASMIARARTVAKGRAVAVLTRARTAARDRVVATPMAVAKATQIKGGLLTFLKISFKGQYRKRFCPFLWLNFLWAHMAQGFLLLRFKANFHQIKWTARAGWNKSAARRSYLWTNRHFKTW
jgi:hypothetical protein